MSPSAAASTHPPLAGSDFAGRHLVSQATPGLGARGHLPECGDGGGKHEDAVRKADWTCV
jgi:hypothetical protein